MSKLIMLNSNLHSNGQQIIDKLDSEPQSLHHYVIKLALFAKDSKICNSSELLKIICDIEILEYFKEFAIAYSINQDVGNEMAHIIQQILVNVAEKFTLPETVFLDVILHFVSEF